MQRANVERVKEEMRRLTMAIVLLEHKAPVSAGVFAWSPKETGAVRRASMDLTRALANLRRADE